MSQLSIVDFASQNAFLKFIFSWTDHHCIKEMNIKLSHPGERGPNFSFHVFSSDSFQHETRILASWSPYGSNPQQLRIKRERIHACFHSGTLTTQKLPQDIYIYTVFLHREVLLLIKSTNKKEANNYNFTDSGIDFKKLLYILDYRTQKHRSTMLPGALPHILSEFCY